MSAAVINGVPISDIVTINGILYESIEYFNGVLLLQAPLSPTNLTAVLV